MPQQLPRRAVLVAVLLAAATPAAAQSPNDFYRGKTVSLLIGIQPGGAYDAYARLLARHIGRHIPGAPTVVVQNMPGAASLVLANYLYSASARDGYRSAFGRGDGPPHRRPLWFSRRRSSYLRAYGLVPSPILLRAGEMIE
jgi:tripartite-type tricarboxylate transporter receptor subunit TctC